MNALERLQSTIEDRKQAGQEAASYSAMLLHKGSDAISKKVIEEATECVLAAKEGDADHLVAEVADLWFHSMLLLSAHDKQLADVCNELARREGKSGLVEKAERGKQA